MIAFILIASPEDNLLSTSKFIEIQLSETELLYLNERLQTKEHMSLDDAMNTIIELEHYYTLCKNDNKSYSPSYMVDKAWHQHILHTEMYGNFSRKHFNLDILHHRPFWTGNIEEVMKSADPEEVMKSADPKEESGPKGTYKAIVSLFGVKNVNETVWLLKELDPEHSAPKTIEHADL